MTVIVWIIFIAYGHVNNVNTILLVERGVQTWKNQSQIEASFLGSLLSSQQVFHFFVFDFLILRYLEHNFWLKVESLLQHKLLL